MKFIELYEKYNNTGINLFTNEVEYEIDYNASSIKELLEIAKNDRKLYNFLYKKVCSEELIVTKDNNIFSGQSIMDFISEQDEDGEMIEPSDAKYTIYVVKSGADIIWKKKVPSDQRLTIQQIASNLPRDNAETRFNQIKTKDAE